MSEKGWTSRSWSKQSHKKIVVPEEMLKAVLEAIREEWGYDSDAIMSSYRYNYGVALEAALRWLSDNPIVPTWEDIVSMSHCVINGKIAIDDKRVARVVVDNCVEWQRRCFLAPEQKDGVVEFLNGTTRPIAVWWNGQRWNVQTTHPEVAPLFDGKK